MKALLAVDGSEASLLAAKDFVKFAQWYREKPTVELVYVHRPLPYGAKVAHALGTETIQRYYHEEGTAALAEAKRALEGAGIEYKPHIVIGEIAESICDLARRASCDMIVVGSRGMGATSNLLLGSQTTKILHIADVPVLVVT